jgi:hypothetical protein
MSFLSAGDDEGVRSPASRRCSAIRISARELAATTTAAPLESGGKVREDGEVRDHCTCMQILRLSIPGEAQTEKPRQQRLKRGT